MSLTHQQEGVLEETLARVTRQHVAIGPSPDIKDAARFVKKTRAQNITKQFTG